MFFETKNTLVFEHPHRPWLIKMKKDDVLLGIDKRRKEDRIYRRRQVIYPETKARFIILNVTLG